MDCGFAVNSTLSKGDHLREFSSLARKPSPFLRVWRSQFIFITNSRIIKSKTQGKQRVEFGGKAGAVVAIFKLPYKSALLSPPKVFYYFIFLMDG